MAMAPAPPPPPPPSFSPPTEGVLHYLDTGIALFDAEERVLAWNRWLANASGIGEEEARGHTLRDLFAATVAPALLEAVSAACRDGLAGVLAHQLHRRPLPLTRGRGDLARAIEQSVMVRPVRIGPVRAVLQVSDVTAAARRERHLRDSQEALRLRTRAVEAASQGIAIVDAADGEARIAYVNPAFTAITGYGEAELIGRPAAMLIRDGEDAAIQAALAGVRAAVQAGQGHSVELRATRKDGSAVWCDLTLSPVHDLPTRPRGAAPAVSHWIGIVRDVSRRVEAQQALDLALAGLQRANATLSQEKRFTGAVLQTVGALVAVLDRRGRIVSFNRACEQLTGLSEAAARGSRLSTLIPEAEAALAFSLETGAVADAITTGLRGAGGTLRRVQWTMTSLAREPAPGEAPGGDDAFLICTGIDVTEREAAERILRAEREVLELVARNAPLEAVMHRLCLAVEDQIPAARAAVLLVDDGRILRACAAPRLPAAYMAALDGCQVRGPVGACGAAVITAQPVFSGDIATDPAWDGIRAPAEAAGLQACWSVPVLSSRRTVLATFAVYWLHRLAAPPAGSEIVERAARLAGLAIERYRADERIRFLALHDPLTGLANRSLLTDHLHTAVAHARRAGERLGLLFIDLDGFKAINDTHGHDAGDDLLAATGRRLASAIRESDVAARLGGDEFVVLVRDLPSPEAAFTVAAKIIEAVSTPLPWRDEALQVGCSIGIALYPEDGEDADTLLTRADDGMYRAKQAGKGQARRL